MHVSALKKISIKQRKTRTNLVDCYSHKSKRSTSDARNEIEIPDEQWDSEKGDGIGAVGVVRFFMWKASVNSHINL